MKLPPSTCAAVNPRVVLLTLLALAVLGGWARGGCARTSASKQWIDLPRTGEAPPIRCTR